MNDERRIHRCQWGHFFCKQSAKVQKRGQSEKSVAKVSNNTGSVWKVGCKVAGEAGWSSGQNPVRAFFGSIGYLPKYYCFVGHLILFRWQSIIASLAKCPIMLRNRIFRLIPKRKPPVSARRERVEKRAPLSPTFVNLKSNTMKNTVQRYVLFPYFQNNPLKWCVS